MATAPFLVEADDEYRLDVSVGRAGRERFALSDRAESLLVDDLEYGNRDVVPWLTVKTLVLTGSVYRRDGKTDPVELAWSISGADDGRRASAQEIERVAEYLQSVEIDQHAIETVVEHVRDSRLSEYVSPDDLRDTGARLRNLRGIAKDL